MTAPDADIPDPSAFDDEDAAMPYEPADQPGGPMGDTLARFGEAYLGRDGVQGVGLGRTEDGNDALAVYLSQPAAAAALPAEFDGYPIMIEITGDIDAY